MSNPDPTAHPARFRSLRWQLPLSYAAIALLAVLALGAALLGTLTSFYAEQERAYLSGNATAIATEIAPLLAAGDLSGLESQIAGYAFLTQSRVQIWDDSNQSVLADSGELSSLSPSIAVLPEATETEDEFGVFEEDITIVVEEEHQNADGSITSQRTVTSTSRIPAQGSLYGFALGAQPSAVTERSNLAVESAIEDDDGLIVGWLRLSQGPAYGRDILRSVAWGWGMAGVVAVALAALAGWLISRRLTRPLLALTAVTTQMAGGDLTARASVTRADEVGLLGRSFNQMADQVENTVTSLRRFTADAAHELHTPLTALQTDLQLLENSTDGAQQQQAARARAQAQRLETLTDNLLELSRLEAQSDDAALTPLDLTPLVQTTGELMASRAEQAGLAFTLTLPDAPLIVRGDANQLQRALINVLDNSLKFTPPPGEIELTLMQVATSAEIRVRDTGIGIPEADRAQLFSRFHRGRNTAAYPGSGLGLAIVQEIVGRHLGRVGVDSNSDGTLVVLTLPLLPPSPQPPTR